MSQTLSTLRQYWALFPRCRLQLVGDLCARKPSMNGGHLRFERALQCGASANFDLLLRSCWTIVPTNDWGYFTLGPQIGTF